MTRAWPHASKRIHAPHLFVEAVVGFVADGHDCAHAARRLANHFRKVRDPFVARNILGIANAFVLPRFDHVFVDVHTRDAQRAKEITLAALIHAEAWNQQFRIQHRFITEPCLFQDLRFHYELDELLRPLALDHKFAALIEDHAHLAVRAGKPSVRNFPQLERVLLQVGQQRRRLFVGKFARCRTRAVSQISCQA
jgi:hypothetical protein